MTPRDASAAYERTAAFVQTIEQQRLEAMIWLDASSGSTQSQRELAIRVLHEYRKQRKGIA